MNYLIKSSVLLAATALVITASTSCNNGKEKEVKKDSTVVVEKKAVPGTPIKYDSSKRYIFLTWDDAPQPPGSNICKKVFEEMDVKATFFMVGMHQTDNRRRYFVDSIRNAYPKFLLANHSYTHGFQNKYQSFYSQSDSAVSDFIRAEKELNIPVKIIRLPGNPTWANNGQIKGPKSTLAVAGKLDALGYHLLGWDVEWEFVGGSKPKQGAVALANTVNEKLDYGNTYEPNCIVILAHDRMFAKQPYTDSLRKFIEVLKADPRNVFETVDHYPLVQKGK
jgi:peptidoglycan/xylan/chitin deacetylase (PgdA/CDA1 family)